MSAAHTSASVNSTQITAGMVAKLRDTGAKVVWRCHIGRDAPTALADEGWGDAEGINAAVRDEEATLAPVAGGEPTDYNKLFL